MSWDTEETKRKIREAAVAAFAQLGPHRATMEHIAKKAGVNKERIYNYFHSKELLFAAGLQEELARAAQGLPLPSDDEDIGDYAGRAYEYHCQHPTLSRLMRWEGLVFEGEVPDEGSRRNYYADKVEAIARGQRKGSITQELDSDHLIFLVFALAGWWSAVPQVARMFTGASANDASEHARRRTSIVKAARRMAARP